MARLLTFALVGFAAQLVDGSLGMAYGVTSTTLLLSTGATPLTASASVHLAELGTTFVSGGFHWRFGNVNWRTVKWIAVPGGAGAFLGALALGSMPAEVARPWVAGFLLFLGAYLLIRFALGTSRRSGVIRGRQLLPLGFVAGFLDAMGGGGWGPITTPTLLATGRMEPRRVIGSVSVSEFVVAICASAGFLASLLRGHVDIRQVAALLAGGVIAAPLAAYTVRKMSPNILGPAVGGLILLTNARTILLSLGWDESQRNTTYLLIAVLCAVVATRSVLRAKGEEGMHLAPDAQ